MVKFAVPDPVVVFVDGSITVLIKSTVDWAAPLNEPIVGAGVEGPEPPPPTPELLPLVPLLALLLSEVEVLLPLPLPSLPVENIALIAFDKLDPLGNDTGTGNVAGTHTIPTGRQAGIGKGATTPPEVLTACPCDPLEGSMLSSPLLGVCGDGDWLLCGLLLLSLRII